MMCDHHHRPVLELRLDQTVDCSSRLCVKARRDVLAGVVTTQGEMAYWLVASSSNRTLLLLRSIARARQRS